MIPLVFGIMVAAGFFALCGLISVQVNQTVTINGVAATAIRTITGEGGVVANPSPVVGKTGTLTTRTSDTAGTLTMASGHGITTGSAIGLYWTNTDGTLGKAYIMTVGTVSGLTVPFTGAAGDALPSQDTAIVAGPFNDAVFNLVGNNMLGLLLCSASSSGYIIVADGSGNLLVAYVTPTNPYVWDSGSGITNPLASQTPTKVLMSQRGTTAEALDMQAIAAVA